jgi:hypothetical protein
MLASFRMAATIAGFSRYREPSGNTQARSHRGCVLIYQTAGKKKPDLAKAFNRATALRSNKCKGRFDARKALKGLRQAT